MMNKQPARCGLSEPVMSKPRQEPAAAARNKRTALILVSVAVVFFVGVVVRRWLFGG